MGVAERLPNRKEGGMKLLQMALKKQDYNLAAHVLVYGLIKAQVGAYAETQGVFGDAINHAHKSNKRQRKA
jgi:hypothetical protein